MNALIGTDPAPEYSRLDRLDGLPRARPVFPYEPAPGDHIRLASFERVGDDVRVTEFVGWFIEANEYMVRWAAVEDWENSPDREDVVLARPRKGIEIYRFREVS